MFDGKLAGKILGVFYERYFENYVIGIPHRGLETIVDAEKTEIVKTIKRLETENMIWYDNGWYKITNYGIDTYEEALPPSSINNRITQRKRILECLNKHYEKNPDENIERDQLVDELKIENTNYILSQMKYLEDNGLINIQLAIGGNFWVRLSAAGSATFDTYEHDDSLPMTNAYRLFFKIENHLRHFIEKKLVDSFDDEWFSKGISRVLRDVIDKRKVEESQMPWKVSEMNSNMDFLQFPQLKNIIITNWVIFSSSFNDQATITLRLDQLEEIRNSIAHTRTLTQDSFNRLEQYGQDILNLIK